MLFRSRVLATPHHRAASAMHDSLAAFLAPPDQARALIAQRHVDYVLICPDLVGFGRSDKPISRDDYTYQRHVDWMRAALFDELDLHDLVLVCQDWGGLIGLRLLAEQMVTLEIVESISHETVRKVLKKTATDGVVRAPVFMAGKMPTPSIEPD